MVDSVPLSSVPHNGFIRRIKVASKIMKIFIIFKESNEINKQTRIDKNDMLNLPRTPTFGVLGKVLSEVLIPRNVL